jgi:hypothetical protein
MDDESEDSEYEGISTDGVVLGFHLNFFFVGVVTGNDFIINYLVVYL